HTKLPRKFLDPLQLRMIESAGIDRNCMDFVPLFAQPEHAKRSIQSAGKGEKSARNGIHGQLKRCSVVLERKRRRSLIHFLLSASPIVISVKASCAASWTRLLAVTPTGLKLPSCNCRATCA